MNYTLHKLPEGFIITSDEKIKEGNKIYWNGKAFGGPNDNIYIEFSGIYEVEESIGLGDGGITLPTNLYLKIGYNIDSYNCKKLIAQQDQIDFSSLSEEEQKEIGWYDTVKFAREEVQNHKNIFFDSKYNMENYGIDRFNAGFQKAQELLSDRRFTLEEVNYLIERCQDLHPKCWEDEIQSISQTSWKVELEMEYDLESIDSSKKVMKPKLINGKIKILKLL
jgi:hypothetical protein